jgi:hypothetical protein
MTDKAPFNLDAALAALEQSERAIRPAVNVGLQARVLGDAAEVAAERAAARAGVIAAQVPQAESLRPAQELPRPGGFRLFGLFDIWSGAAVTALALCLVVGIGVGYEAGPQVMATAGLADREVAIASNESDGAFLFEDIL